MANKNSKARRRAASKGVTEFKIPQTIPGKGAFTLRTQTITIGVRPRRRPSAKAKVGYSAAKIMAALGPRK